MKQVRSIILLLAITYGLNAQQKSAHISFRKIDHDFGTINEVAGPVSVTFSYINTGSSPLILQDVTSSCGCTTPDYTKQPVMPGDSGFVKATYNPSGRPGPFTKDITIKCNADNSPIILRIKGSVNPRELKLEEQYRFSMGPVRFESSHIGFGRMYYGETKPAKLKMVNTTDKPVKLMYNKLPVFFKVKSTTIVLQPKQTMDLEISYDTKAKNDWGFLVDYVKFSIDGKADPEYKLTITADISEDFSKLTEQQKANAPYVEFETPTYDFGYVREGTPVEYIFKFVNKGKSDLLVHKVSATCSCTVTESGLKVVKPGQSSFIKVKFNTQGYPNSQTKPITVITNDPARPQLTLWMKGVVRKANE